MSFASRCLVLVFFTGYSFMCWGCKPGKEDNTTISTEWKMMMSDVVAHGVVVSTDPDPSSTTGAYSVLFEVMCSYKAEEPLPQFIRINKVGYNPDTCLTTNLTVGPKYLVYLKETNGQYVLKYRQESGESQYVEEIVVMCDASVQYPIGKDENNSTEKCPEKYAYDDCVVRPVIPNPPYSNGDNHIHSVSSGETVDQQTQEKSPEGEDIPRKSPAGVVDDNGGSVTLTLNLGAMILPLLAIILPL